MRNDARQGVSVADRTGQTTWIAHGWSRAAARAIGFVALWIALMEMGSAAQPGAKSRQMQRNQTQSKKSGGLFSLFSKDKQRTSRDRLIDQLPTARLTNEAKQRIASVTNKPTLYRQLPERQFRCDPELFVFLARHPETIVGIWDVMGITEVQTKRVGPYELDADDGSGTTCRIDLLYGDRNLHVFVAEGKYDGKFTQKPVTGKGVFLLRSTYTEAADGSTVVIGTLDCYVKFDNLGADLLARSFGGLIGHSADHNFTETAKFIEQVWRVSCSNPTSMLELADQLPQVDAATQAQFARMITSVAIRHLDKTPKAAKLLTEKGVAPSSR
ncbi:MAG: hypothetical protein AAFU85_01170 [Planctomycetota bacterium]